MHSHLLQRWKKDFKSHFWQARCESTEKSDGGMSNRQGNIEKESAQAPPVILSCFRHSLHVLPASFTSVTLAPMLLLQRGYSAPSRPAPSTTGMFPLQWAFPFTTGMLSLVGMLPQKQHALFQRNKLSFRAACFLPKKHAFFQSGVLFSNIAYPLSEWRTFFQRNMLSSRAASFLPKKYAFL